MIPYIQTHPRADQFANRVVAVLGAQLLAGLGDLGVDGLGRRAQGAGDRLALIVGGDIGHDLALALGQARHPRLRLGLGLRHRCTLPAVARRKSSTAS